MPFLTFVNKVPTSEGMFLYNGYIGFTHFVRANGLWSCDGYDGKSCGIKDLGKVSSLSEITGKNVSGGDKETNFGRADCRYFYVTFQPYHGYAVMFTTENGEQKYMRIYATADYSFDTSGQLTSVTLQYQLY